MDIALLTLTLHPTALLYKQEGTTLRHLSLCLCFGVVCFRHIISISSKIFSYKETMIFICIYLQPNHLVSVRNKRNLYKILNHIEKQNKMTEVVTNTRNLGMLMTIYRKIRRLQGRSLVNDSVSSKST